MMICKAETSLLFSFFLFTTVSLAFLKHLVEWKFLVFFFLVEKKLNVTIGVRWKAADPTAHLKESGLTDAFRMEFSRGELL